MLSISLYGKYEANVAMKKICNANKLDFPQFVEEYINEKLQALS